MFTSKVKKKSDSEVKQHTNYILFRVGCSKKRVNLTCKGDSYWIRCVVPSGNSNNFCLTKKKTIKNLKGQFYKMHNPKSYIRQNLNCLSFSFKNINGRKSYL